MTPRGPSSIHLDTSFLIRAFVPRSQQSGALRGWLRARRPMAISALVWGEFLCGPLATGAEALALRLVPRHIPVGTAEAARAAWLFNETGRRRGSFPDCLVAATALEAGACLATADRRDFQRFTDSGLDLVG